MLDTPREQAVHSGVADARVRQGTRIARPGLPTPIPVVFFLALTAVALTAILAINGGQFTYTLDDPYIHLTLARTIRHGGYGINAGEWAAPSSSIVWPLLLAAWMDMPFAAYIPLLLNIVIGCVTVAVIQRFFQILYRDVDPSRRALALVGSTIVSMLVTNTVGLVFTGMEHSLQVLTAIAVLVGIVQERQTGVLNWWMAPALVLGPLVRYENLAIVAPVLVYLFVRGHRRAAIASGVAITVVLAGFSLFLYGHGLGILPSSIVAKSTGTSSTVFAWPLIRNILLNFFSWSTLPFLLIAYAIACKFRSADRALVVVALVAAMLHFCIGRFGWMARYEIYIYAFDLLTLAWLYRGELVTLATQRKARYSILAAAGTLALGTLYIVNQFNIPQAANNIYEQQFQISRFVAEYYRQPVAVNDLGLVAYRGGQYVLDVWGLGSHEALDLRLHSQSGEWMQTLADRHDVRLAIVYADWFPERPKNWIPLASMSMSRPGLMNGRTVTFFALDEQTAAKLIPLLEQFGATLPDGVSLVVKDR